DDRRIEPANRQPRVSISVVAIGDLEITLAAGERTQIPGDELRRVIARWKSFGGKVVLRRDGHTLASSGADWVPGGRGPKQAQAHDISLLRRFVRVTVVPGEEEAQLRGNRERFGTQDAGERLGSGRQAAQKPRQLVPVGRDAFLH